MLLWGFTLVRPVLEGGVLNYWRLCAWCIVSESCVLLIKLNFAYMYFSTKSLSKYGDWSSRFWSGYVVFLFYSLYAKMGVCGLRIYCVLCFMVMKTGR